MPLALAGASIECDKRRTVEVVSGTETAVVVDSCAIGRNVNEIVLGVCRQRRPRRDITSPFPCVVFPCLMAVFAWLRDNIKLPLERASAGVVTEDIAWHVFYARLVIALLC